MEILVKLVKKIYRSSHRVTESEERTRKKKIPSLLSNETELITQLIFLFPVPCSLFPPLTSEFNFVRLLIHSCPSYCLLPIAYCLLPIAYCLLPEQSCF